MARPRRPHLPGAVFHLVARTQGHEPWFTEHLRGRITTFIASAVPPSDSRLLAYVVMPNHLHLVLQQGKWPLDRLMQPLLCRIALLVRRRFGTEGHVFERRFRHRHCADPEYIRNSIVYTHLNPVRAGIVGDPSEYLWSSHALYVRRNSGPLCMRRILAADHGLGLFSPRESADPAEVRQSYDQFVRRRMERDQRQADEELGLTDSPDRPQTAPPPLLSAEASWSRIFAPIFVPPRGADELGREAPRASRLGLPEIARQVLRESGTGIPLERVRSNEKGRAVVRLRRMMVVRMSAAGHRGCAIARYLHVSDQCVSNILGAQRRRTP